MSVKQKRTVIGGGAACGVAVAALVAAAIVSRTAGVSGDVHRITVISEGMSFRVAEEDRRNPTLSVPAGRPVEIHFRNEAVGGKHNLAVPAAGVRTPILAPGESAVVRFTLSEGRSARYRCDLHPLTMRGTIRTGDSAQP